jgi:hypothetical protein
VYEYGLSENLGLISYRKLEMRLIVDKHTFSIVMDGKRHVKNVLISDKLNRKVFIEGDLGKFVTIEIVEEVLLEIQGTNGILRVRARSLIGKRGPLSFSTTLRKILLFSSVVPAISSSHQVSIKAVWSSFSWSTMNVTCSFMT